MNVVKIVFVLQCICSIGFTYAQTITGTLKQCSNQVIKLEGFNGLQTYIINQAQTDSLGKFSLKFSSDDYGVAYLISNDNKPFFVILSNENIEFVGASLLDTKSITITKSYENQWFEQYANEQPKREQAFSAWEYLDKLYTNDALFAVQKVPNKAIIQEKKRLQNEEISFLNSLPKESYSRWYLPTRKLVSTVKNIAQYRTNEIPATINAFRNLDYTDKRLYKSGLYRDAIESHFWLLENCGKPLDSVYLEMQHSIDMMLVHLVKDEKKLNEVTDYLFDLLERHSLFTASEYLAIKVLNEVSCTINSDLAKQLETYRAMKKGNIAPDIVFPELSIQPKYNFQPKSLAEYKTDYTLVVFGSSTCPKCKEEIPEVAKKYETWLKNSVEVLFISLDKEMQNFIPFAGKFPFVSICDFQGWNSSIAQNYYVFGTPTMYLLDKNRKIILRPNSVKQMDAWVEWVIPN